MKDVLEFSEFINEELNIERETGVIKLESDWFYYNYEDDIIYGCDEKPVGDKKLFSFNPSSCTLIVGGEEKQYDVNNPICLIQYKFNDEKIEIYTDNAIECLQCLGFKRNDVISSQSRNQIMDIFDKEEDDSKYILIFGNQLIASTFDIIEEE